MTLAEACRLAQKAADDAESQRRQLAEQEAARQQRLEAR